jgi:predicted RNA-binding Zn ribbon-like protein
MAVQRGEGLASQADPFDLSGGRLCLDFANTVEDRLKDEQEDRLGDYSELVSWAEQAGVIESGAAAALRAEAAERPAEAEATLSAAQTLREALFVLFSAVAKGQSPPDGSLAELNAALPSALSALRVEKAGGAFEWRWSLEERGLDGVLLPVIRDAAELLTSAELSRVRECESGTCAWLFLDGSRNQTRRWCDMSTCGNRAKARRHYQRRKR